MVPCEQQDLPDWGSHLCERRIKPRKEWKCFLIFLPGDIRSNGGKGEEAKQRNEETNVKPSRNVLPKRTANKCVDYGAN